MAALLVLFVAVVLGPVQAMASLADNAPGAFLLETDSPDIPPVEARDRPNTPANIVHNLRAASEILALSESEIAENTTRNAARIFGFWVVE